MKCDFQTHPDRITVFRNICLGENSCNVSSKLTDSIYFKHVQLKTSFLFIYNENVLMCLFGSHLYVK